jgi:hypothetical protein
MPRGLSARHMRQTCRNQGTTMNRQRIETLITSAESKLIYHCEYLANAMDALNTAEKKALLTKWHCIADAHHILNRKG